MRAAARPGCAFLLPAGLAQTRRPAQAVTAAARRDAGTPRLLRAGGVPGTETAAMARRPGVFRPGDAPHRLALLRTVRHGGVPGVAAIPDCRAAAR